MVTAVEIDELLHALGCCFVHAARQLERRAAALLAALAPSGAETGPSVRFALAGRDVDLPLLTLIAARRHRVAELAVELTCRFEQVDTPAGTRFGVRPRPDGSHRLEIVAGEPGVVELRIDGQALRNVRVDAEAADAPHARHIPRAGVLLLAPGDASQLTMDAPAKAQAEARQADPPRPEVEASEQRAWPVAPAWSPAHVEASGQLCLWSAEERGEPPGRAAEQLSLRFPRGGDDGESAAAATRERGEAALAGGEATRRIVADETDDLRAGEAARTLAGKPGDRDERPVMSFEEFVDGLVDEATAGALAERLPRAR